ncbi:MAG: universal stress protein [Acidimicrobiales bacterium]
MSKTGWMMLSRLLVGDDGSPGAAAARTWAGSLAGAAGAEVVVATVVAPTSVGQGVARARPAGTQELAGAPATALLAFADEIAADLVVVGRRGAGGFEAMRLGSTAHQVAEHASRPVAIVPASGPPRGGWPFATIAVGLDGSLVGAGALSWAVPLAVASSAAVFVVHALEMGPAFMAAGLIEAYAQAMAQTNAAVEDWCGPLREAGLTYTTVLEEGGPVGVLLHAVSTHGADLLVVGRRTRGAFPGMEMGSAAHRALGFSPCPTVVVPGNL